MGIGLAAKLLRRGAEAVGLAWADRFGGGVLGAAEGALVAGLVIFGAMWLLGEDHAMLEQSRSIEVYDQAREFVQRELPELPDVASPPPRKSE